MADKHLQFLVIDDDTSVIMLLKGFLKNLGNVVGAGSGKEALTALNDTLPDVIFVDIGLPDMTGFELISHIKAKEHLVNVPVVMITADGEVKNHVTALEAGADEFLAKPLDGKLAIELVNKVLKVRDGHLLIGESSRYENSFAINLLENLAAPTFVINADGYVVIWNKACERLTGLKTENVIGTKNHWRGFYDKPRVCLVDMLLPANRDTETKIDALYNLVEKDAEDNQRLQAENWCVMPLLGEKKYLTIDAGPIYDASGKLIAAVESLRDLTELKETQAKFEKLSTIDALTGLGNRGFFDVQLDALWFSTRRHRQHISLLMMDVDYFKNYNDHYGHPKGDECLKVVATVLSKSITRALDMAFRYGGEEFCVLLPDTDSKSAETIAQRIIDSLAQVAMEHEKSLLPQKVVTISIGISTFLPDQESDSKDLVLAADQALYEAKSSGRARYNLAKTN
jgi:diguanylate cyclase (GGDEF)-like protein